MPSHECEGHGRQSVSMRRAGLCNTRIGPCPTSVSVAPATPAFVEPDGDSESWSGAGREVLRLFVNGRNRADASVGERSRTMAARLKKVNFVS